MNAKNILLTALWCIFSLQSAIAQTTWDAADRYSVLGTGQLLQNASVAIGSDQSLYVVGDFRNMVCFDTIVLNAPVPGRTHGYLLKLDAQMRPIWARQFPEKPYDLTLDAQDNVFIAGSRWNAAGSDDTLTYVAKYSSNGTLLATIHATGTAKNWAKVVRTDAAGNCYIAGERFSSGTSQLGGITLAGHTGSRECFIARINSNLTTVNWVRITGSSPNLDNVYDLEIDNQNGYIYAAGNYSQVCGNFFCTFYNGDFFVEKHQLSTGASVWKKVFSGGSGTSTKQFARLSHDGQSLLVAACFKKTTQFSPTLSLTANPGNDDYHIFVAEVRTSDANVNWAQKVSTTGDAYLWRMARAGDRAWLAGYYLKTTNVPPFSLPASSDDGFLIEVGAANGAVAAAERQWGINSDQTLALSHRDDILAVGGNTSFSSTLNIGDGAFVLPGSNTSMFAARKGGQSQLPPIASFASSTLSGCAPLTVQFENNSEQNPTWLQWQFQGGYPAISNAKSPSVVFNSPGTYTVTLTATNGGGSSTSTVTVQVNSASPVNPGFAFSVDGLSAAFTGSATNATSYLWNFDDGNTSTEPTPQHTYAECGAYTVTLTVSNPCSTASSTQTVIIGGGTPTAAASLTVSNLQLICQNNSTNATSYLWDFGDGNTSAAPNPQHTYATGGIYAVTLSATNICGTSTYTQTIFVTPCEGPIAAFSSDKTEACVGENVTLFSLSSNAQSLLWTFPGADPLNSNEPVAVISYSQPGVYPVVLNAINACGNDQYIAQAFIKINPLPAPAFEYTAAGLFVQFDNLSEDAASYLWEFGDGQTSTDANPAHTYNASGTYQVTLFATNDCGQVSASILLTLSTSATSSPFDHANWSVFPNPSTGMFVLETSGANGGEMLLSVHNVAGQNLHNEQIVTTEGNFAHQIDLRHLPAGTYWLRGQSDRKIWQKQLLIQK